MQCSWCGKDPADGFASMTTSKEGYRRFCHGDHSNGPTCYEQASHAQTRGNKWVLI